MIGGHYFLDQQTGVLEKIIAVRLLSHGISYFFELAGEDVAISLLVEHLQRFLQLLLHLRLALEAPRPNTRMYSSRLMLPFSVNKI